MRGHRYAGASFARHDGRHFSTPKMPDLQTGRAAPQKTDAEIQAAAEQEKLTAGRRRGRRSTQYTTGAEPPAMTTAGSLTTPGGSQRLGAA